MTTQITPIEKTLAAIEEAKFQKEVERIAAANDKFPSLLDAINHTASYGGKWVVWERVSMTPAIKDKLESEGYLVENGFYSTDVNIDFRKDYRKEPKPAPKKSFFQYLVDTETGAFRGRGGAFILGVCAMSALIIFVSILPSILRSIGLI